MPDNHLSMFAGRKIVIATQHKKETVIAPILEESLKVHCFADKLNNTDELGTFSGEIERKLDPISAAREKCLKAMHANHCDIGVASEGSFGAHPSLFFMPADHEVLIFIDLSLNLEIIVHELSTETNFNGKEINSEKELLNFAQTCGFPSHALILRKSKTEAVDIIKGIHNIEDLKASFRALRSKYPVVYAETDMRAMHNPTRMLVIKKATLQLIQRIQSVCPKCNMPGFGITDTRKGLRCSLCGSPTQSILSTISVCSHCNYTQEQWYPNGKQTEDPMYCDFCNP
jgi:hypothetical protein